VSRKVICDPACPEYGRSKPSEAPQETFCDCGRRDYTCRTCWRALRIPTLYTWARGPNGRPVRVCDQCKASRSEDRAS
jgi:hypothetical protein